ncbi:MAG: NAD(P) transhydrogenase subunit alpha [Alphaproteobacteria bacterium]|nr:NAD(P) transhydrogenase subunit alpha [Alphaproteobacteria bacterium]
MTTETKTLIESYTEMADRLRGLAAEADQIASDVSATTLDSMHTEPFIITALTVFVLACFVGYHVVWRVTPALHSPLMGITNAISSVIIVGAILAAGPIDGGFSKFLGFLAITLASVNIFGGFIITKRMLNMFQKKT